MDENVVSLEARISALAIEQRHYKRVVLAILTFALLCLVGWQAQGSDTPTVIKAHRIELVDDHNQLAVSLGSDKYYKGGAVTVYSESGKRGWLIASPSGGALKLVNGSDEKTQTSICLYVSKPTQFVGVFGPAGSSGTGPATFLKTVDGHSQVILSDPKFDRLLTTTGDHRLRR
jgi:hypothetical protein